MSRPNARSILSHSLIHSACARTVIGLVRVHFPIEQDFNREWHLQGDEEPLEKASLGQREIIGVALCLIDTVQFENDHDPKLIGASVVLPHDARFPQAPHVRDFLRQIRLERFVRHAWLHTVVGNDFHPYSFFSGLDCARYTPRASITSRATAPPEYCCCPVIRLPSRTACALKRPDTMKFVPGIFFASSSIQNG